MQRDDSERPDDKPTSRRAGPARFIGVALIVLGTYSLVTSAIDVVRRVIPLLVVAAVLTLVVMSRVKRKP